MSNNLVASRDGVMLKVGDEIRQLYKDAAVPKGADPDHVALLEDRGLLVDSGTDEAGEDDLDAWVSNATVGDVLVYVDEHPEQKDAVLAAEKAGKNRVSIVDKLEAS